MQMTETEVEEVAQAVDAEVLVDVRDEEVEGLEEYPRVLEQLRDEEDLSIEPYGASVAEVQADLAQLRAVVQLQQLTQWALGSNDSSIKGPAQVCRGQASHSRHWRCSVHRFAHGPVAYESQMRQQCESAMSCNALHFQPAVQLKIAMQCSLALLGCLS